MSRAGQHIEQRMIEAYAQAFRQCMAHACATMAGLNDNRVEQAIAMNWPQSEARALAGELAKEAQP